MDKEPLLALISRQLTSLFTFCEDTDSPLLREGFDRAMPRVEHCFSRVRQKYFDLSDPSVDPFHSGKYCIFLYILAREIYREAGNEAQLCDRLYYLNRTLNGVDLFYQVELPRVFFLDHPLGSILGRAQYGEFFSFSQGVTVGNNKGIYPSIGTFVELNAGATVLGDSAIGDEVIISANAFVKDTTIPDRSIVFGQSPDLVIKPLNSIAPQHWPSSNFFT